MAQSKKSNLQVIKTSNMNMILRLIHDSTYLSRAEIKRITGLAPTTVSTLVDELIEKGLVRETGVLDTGGVGRKAISVEINPMGMKFAGVDIESERVAVGIYDFCFNTLSYAEREVSSYEQILDFAVSQISPHPDISAVTVGVSGIIDTKKGKILLSTVMDIADEDLAGDIKRAFPHTEVMLLNSSGLIAFAEAQNRGVEDLISVDIGKGVGSGIIINGKIYTGIGGTAGELGHISVNMHGDQCKCGNRGCIELYTNTNVIRQSAGQILGISKVSLERIRQEWESGNEQIEAMLLEIADTFSFALVGLINMMAPEIVVIGGKIKELGDAFLNPLKAKVCEKYKLRETKIEYSSVDGNPVTLGGARYAFNKIIN